MSSVEGQSNSENGLGGQPSNSGFVRIKRIRMVGFRSFEDYSLDLPPGLVFICGPNESGKTGIMKAVQLGLFTDAATSRQDVRRLARWGSDEGFRIELVLEDQDGQWEIIRDFDTKSNILNKPDGTRVRDKNRILEIVAGLLGIPKDGAEAAYEASVCVHQDELASRGDDLKKLIENRVLGGGVDVIKLANDAARRISDLEAGKRGGIIQGELTEARLRISELEDKLRDVDFKAKTGQEERIRVLGFTEQVERLGEEVLILEQMLKKAQAYATAQNTYGRESKELNNVIEQRQTRKRLEERLAQIAPQIRDLSESKKELDAEHARRIRLDEVERDIALARGEMARLSELRTKAKKLLDEADEAEARIGSLTLIDPQKVDEAEKLNQNLAHYKQALIEAQSACEQLRKDLARYTDERERKSEQELRLATLLETRKRAELLDSVSAEMGKIEPAITRYKDAEGKLLALAPISERDVKEAIALSAEISAMGKVPYGLNVEINTSSGAEARFAIDQGPLQNVESGLSTFTARKRIELEIPDTVDVRVNTTDAEQYFAGIRQAQGKLNKILRRYGIETAKALSQAFDEYRSTESAVASYRQRLSDLVESVNTAQFQVALAAKEAGAAEVVEVSKKGGAEEVVEADEAVKAGEVVEADEVVEAGEVGIIDKAYITPEVFETLETNEGSNDLSYVAKGIAASLRAYAGDTQQAVSNGLLKLGMIAHELRMYKVSKIELEFQAAKNEVQTVDRNIAKLNGKIDGLKLKEKEELVQSIERSIAGLVEDAGCASLEDMIAKRDELQSLSAMAKDRRSRAGDLLGDKTIETLEGRITALSDKVLGLGQEKCSILAKGPVPGDLRQQLHNTEQELSQKQSERDRILGQVSAIDPDQLEQKQIEILARLVPAQAAMQDNVAYEMAPEEMIKKEIEHAEKKQLLEQVTEQKNIAEARVQVITEGAEDVASVAEELEYARRQLAHLEREVKILETLKTVFPEARTRAVSGMFDLLSQASSKYIGQMTNGKYTKMEIAEDFSPLLYSEARGEPISGAKEKNLLSAGTVDQVLLAVRFAVADLMSQGKCPPIIMDDPFVHFDPARREAGIQVLKEISDAYQVIVLTCHDYEGIAAGQKVRLSR